MRGSRKDPSPIRGSEASNIDGVIPDLPCRICQKIPFFASQSWQVGQQKEQQSWSVKLLRLWVVDLARGCRQLGTGQQTGVHRQTPIQMPNAIAHLPSRQAGSSFWISAAGFFTLVFLRYCIFRSVELDEKNTCMSIAKRWEKKNLHRSVAL